MCTACRLPCPSTRLVRHVCGCQVKLPVDSKENSEAQPVASFSDSGMCGLKLKGQV